MPDLSNLDPFHIGRVENSYFYVLSYNSAFHIMINYCELTSCIENSVGPDQLASSVINNLCTVHGYI